MVNKMVHDQRLSGPTRRHRVLALVHGLHILGALDSQDEANDMLAAANEQPLDPTMSGDADLLKLLVPTSDVSPSSLPPRRQAILSNAPPVPARLFGRDDDLVAVLRLLARRRRSALTRAQHVVAIRGMAGVGKTTLAAAVVNTEAMRHAYPDAVIWISLDQQPNILAELGSLALRLGVNLDGVRSIDAMRRILAESIRTKRILVVLDDVWEPQHALAFLIGGGESATLIITRERGVLDNLELSDTNTLQLDVLSEHAGLQLIESIYSKLVANHPEQCLKLVQTLEGLPLALIVAARLLKRELRAGYEIGELLNDITPAATRVLAESAPVGFTSLDEQTRPTVAALLRKSTDRLNPDVRNAYALLGFAAPKPARFTIDLLNAVWQTTDARPVIRELVDRGLLEPISRTKDFQMHALLVAHAEELLKVT